MLLLVPAGCGHAPDNVWLVMYYIYIYVYTYMHMYIYIYIYICVCVHVYVCMYACMHACMHACMCAYILLSSQTLCWWNMYITCSMLCECVYMYNHICICKHTNIYIYIYMCVHLCIYNPEGRRHAPDHLRQYSQSSIFEIVSPY